MWIWQPSSALKELDLRAVILDPTRRAPQGFERRPRVNERR
ncbi:MAG: hypothetical protein ACREIT_10440 [Tepidisphaeraceae bacterium]